VRPDSSSFETKDYAMNQTQPPKIAFIQASWHSDIVQQSYAGFKTEIEKQGINTKRLKKFEVPGSLEIPLQAQLLAKTREYSIIVCAGLIVDGGIYRHEFVAQSVLDGIMRVQLDYEVPILSIILTPHLFQNSEEHRQFFFNHFYKKGIEAASACIDTLENVCELSINEAIA
jgi:6,7-dimethyl-8-ribityllumazine synthase